LFVVFFFVCFGLVWCFGFGFFCFFFFGVLFLFLLMLAVAEYAWDVIAKRLETRD